MLYTKKGDDGTTSLANNKKISKCCANIEALGAIDELNAFLGICKVKVQEKSLLAHNDTTAVDILTTAQNNLFIIQAMTAGAAKKIAQSEITDLENCINTIENELPPIRHFCIPGGSELSAFFDVARTITRRAERALIAAAANHEIPLSVLTKAYINRLSSLFFALARLANHRAGIAEESPTYNDRL